MTAKVLLMLTFFCSLAGAQTLRIGIVLSQTGTARMDGAAQARAVQALANDYASQGSAFEQSLEFILRDDASSPERALTLARDLVNNEEVHALVCCTTAAATQNIAPFVAEARVLTLGLSDLPAARVPSLFTVVPEQERLLQSVVLDRTQRNSHRFALMTLDNSFGDEVEASLNRLISPDADVYLSGVERYRPDARALTPEALLIATGVPDTVFVWGLATDTVRAYSALRARGYEGDVVINPDLLEPAFQTDLAKLEGALVPVSPVINERAESSALQTFQRILASSYGPGQATVAAAQAYDALLLIQEALEQAYTYGIPLDELSAFRGVLRDAFIGMGPLEGASAVYDYSETDPAGVLPESLILAKLENGRLHTTP